MSAYGIYDPRRLRERLAFARFAVGVCREWASEGWDQRRELQPRECELATRLMYWADRAEEEPERVERVNEATRLIRDIYLTDRSPLKVLCVAQKRVRLAEEKMGGDLVPVAEISPITGATAKKRGRPKGSASRKGGPGEEPGA